MKVNFKHQKWLPALDHFEKKSEIRINARESEF
jgi:hypothetical protein